MSKKTKYPFPKKEDEFWKDEDIEEEETEDKEG